LIDCSVGAGAGGAGGHLSGARPACSRVLRVERLTHVIMTSPGWRTLLVTWNDHMQSWIKTGKGTIAVHSSQFIVKSAYHNIDQRLRG